MKKFILLPLLSVIVFLSSCNDDETVTETEGATLRLMLEHNFNGEPFNLEEDYVTENGDTITASELKYFLSNIKFFDNDGNEFAVPNSYHLVELEEGSHIRIMDVEPTELHQRVPFICGSKNMVEKAEEFMQKAQQKSES